MNYKLSRFHIYVPWNNLHRYKKKTLQHKAFLSDSIFPFLNVKSL